MGNRDELRSLRCLRDVSDQGVYWLTRHTDEREFPVGEVLIVEGAEDRDCYFIIEGRTEVSAGGTVLGESGAGEPEGEMALFFRRPRGATTTVTAPVRALILRSADWDQLETDEPVVANDIRAGILQHLGRRFSSR